jgi:hypothetical protein
MAAMAADPQQPSAPGRPIEMTLIGHRQDWAADRRRLPVLGKGGSLSGCGAVSRRALHGPGGGAPCESAVRRSRPRQR